MLTFEREYAFDDRGCFASSGVAAWVASILELYEGEWLSVAQIEAEIESRSGMRPSGAAVRRKVYRLLADGVLESRIDPGAPLVFGRFQVKQYSWKR